MNHPTPKPYLLQRVYDIRSWIESQAVELHAHTVPKCFKFELNDAGKAVMYYRNWSHEQCQGPIVVLKSYEWPVTKLKNARRTELAPPSAHLPPDLLELREKEVQPTQEIYTGRYRNPREREAPIEMTDDFLDKPEVGCFVALFFDNWNKEPVIGRVLSVGEHNFHMHYWRGSYNGKWSPQNIPRRKTEPWLKDLPKSYIVCCEFDLTGIKS